jgi:hypothetical protein
VENKIQEMIKLYEEDKDFFGRVDDKRIEIIENELSVTFPPDTRIL